MDTSEATRILVLCTGNICRSPMAAALLAAHLADAGVDARVTSAGFRKDGWAAAEGAVVALAARKLDGRAHRSRKLTADMVREADIIVGMAREHVVAAVALAPEAWARSFTLKELLRRGDQVGARRPGQPLVEWLNALHVGRRPVDLFGASPVDDVEDPIGQPQGAFDAIAAQLDQLTAGLADLLAGSTVGVSR